MWDIKDVEGHIKGLTAKQKRAWVAIANDALARCIEAGGTDETCAPKVIRMANGRAKQVAEAFDRVAGGDALAEVGRVLSGASRKAIKAALEALSALLTAADNTEAEESAAGALHEAAIILRRGQSWDSKRRLLSQALAEKHPGNERTSSPWVRDIYDDLVIFEKGDVLFQAAYTIDKTKTPPVAILGDETEVEIAYVPVGEGMREGKTDPLPKKKDLAQESSDLEFVGEYIPLVERAVHEDGTIGVKIIQPGWGSSGYYPAEVLERDGPKVFKAGVKMFVDHPTITEEKDRPERSVRDLAAQLTGDARWEKDGKAGAGLYAEAKVFKPFQEFLGELAPHIGVSIRGTGKARAGEAEGKQGRVVEQLVSAQSVDFVTAPGAGGKILQLFEAARGRVNPEQEESSMTEQEIQELKDGKAAADADNRKLRETLLLRESSDFVAAQLKETKLPQITQDRLAKQVAADPPVKEGKLDTDALKTRVEEAVKAERDYLAALTGAGQVRGMGASEPNDREKAREELKEAFRVKFSRQGYSKEETEQMAECAATGR